MPTKPECEKAIRSLVTQWAGLNGIQRGQTELPSFDDFCAWLRREGHGQYLQFRSVMGPREDAEQWFDQELGQTWRN